jgi:hypothetical protein
MISGALVIGTIARMVAVALPAYTPPAFMARSLLFCLVLLAICSPVSAQPTFNRFKQLFDSTSFAQEVKISGWRIHLLDHPYSVDGFEYNALIEVSKRTEKFFSPCYLLFTSDHLSLGLGYGDLIKVVTGTFYTTPRQVVPDSAYIIHSSKIIEDFSYAVSVINARLAQTPPSRSNNYSTPVLFLSQDELTDQSVETQKRKPSSHTQKPGADTIRISGSSIEIVRKPNIFYTDQPFKELPEPRSKSTNSFSTYILRKDGVWYRYECVTGHYFKYDSQRDRVSEYDESGFEIMINPFPKESNPANRNGMELR